MISAIALLQFPLYNISTSEMNGRGYVKWWMRALSQSSIMKTTTRNAAKHSLHGPICNLALIAYTHFIPIGKLSAVKMFEPRISKELTPRTSSVNPGKSNREGDG
jgi:hypothetical protein